MISSFPMLSKKGLAEKYTETRWKVGQHYYLEVGKSGKSERKQRVVR